MNRFWKLLNWEINRFAKLYAVLGLLTLLLQCIGIIVFANSFMSKVTKAMEEPSISAADYAAQNGTVDFLHYSETLWFDAPILLCIASLLLYAILIWYREWFGKSTIIYRLLMLPTSRMNVYVAKTSAILLFVLGLIAFQLVILLPETQIFNSLIPSVLRKTLTIQDIIRSHTVLNVLFPVYFIQFILYYGAGMMAVIVLFTAILLERSFKWKGIAAAVVYALAEGFLFILPILISQIWVPDYFFPSEMIKMEIVAGILVICSSVWFSSYLLKRKVTV